MKKRQRLYKVKLGVNKASSYKGLLKGEGGIRTLGDSKATLVFKTNALNRSATSPSKTITRKHLC
jgi:hypothetical protein